MMTGITSGEKKRTRWLLLTGALFLFVYLLSISIASAEQRIEGKKNVLILNSYHEGFKWTDDITRGVISALEPVSGQTRIFIEYMNTKWVKDDLYFRELRQILKHKYAGTRFDLIVSSDNDAFDFLRNYRDEVFGKVPVVFNGVNYFKQSDLAGTTLFTGVSETADLRKSLELALRLHPSAKRIFVINDYDISGRKVKEELETLAPNFRGRARIEYENHTDLEKILKDVEALPPDSLIFFTFFYGDPARQSYDNSECISLISRHARVPVYGAWDFNLGYGIVGGKLTSGYDQGVASGRMGLRILRGEMVEDIPPLLRSQTRYMFDYRQMARFGIKKSVLPEGSIVINGPKTFHEIPNQVIWATLVGIAFLCGMILMLLHVNRRRKRSEEALQKAHEELEKRVEERTRDLAETVQTLRFTQFAIDRTQDQAFWLTEDGRFFYVNDAACRSLGYSREELLGMSVPDINPTCPPEDFPPYWNEARKKGSSTFETFHRAKDGRVFPVELRTSHVTFEGREYNCAFAADITERRRAEETLRESEERLKMAMDLAKLVQWEYDVRSGMFTFNDQFYALYSTTEEREGGTLMSAEDYVRKFIPPEESAMVAGGVEEVLANSCNQLEHRIIRADGEERFIVVRGEAVRDQTGYVVKIRGANQDITERKQAEETLLLSQFCIDKAGIGIYQSDETGTICRVNEHACKSLGYSREELCALSVLDLDPEITREKMLELKEILDERGLATIYSTHRRKDGTTFPVEITINSVDFKGKRYGISFVKDITERRQAEEALRESESRVRRKLESILDPEGDTGDLELADILDAPQIQALMDDLYRITGFKMSIIDLKGRVLADVGWQDICSKFHRNHPETLKRCHESDTDLTVGIPQGEFRTYRCKNNIWHIVTPIFIGERHMGNLFMGQFFFADEQIDYDLFRAQARRYGFPEEDYIAALKTVPRHGEELVNLGKAVFLRLTDMFSKLSYANIKLAHSVAERDRLTATLRESEALLKLAMDLAKMGAWEYDAGTGLFSFDDQFYALYGTTVEREGGPLMPAEVYARKFIPPEESSVVADGIEHMRANSYLQVEHRIIRADGEKRFIIVRGEAVFDQEGRFVKIRGANQDITERKLAEEAIRESRAKYQALVDSFDGFIYICSQDYRVEFMNRKLIERTGYEATGELCFKMMHDRDSVCPWCVNERVFAGETVHWEMFSPKDNRWYYVVNVPIRHADGSKSKQSMIIDITDRKLFEEELQRQKQLLQDLNDTLENKVEEEVAKNREKDIMLIQQNRQAALGEMLDHIAHQWKQPLNSISLIVQDLGESASDGELTDELVEENAGKIMALLGHMAQTIDIFRGFYRSDKEKKVFSIKDSIGHALEFIAPAFRFHSIAVELDVDPGLTAFGYPKEYAQVLLNILANARDAFMARGTEKPRVIIRAFAENNKTVVTITDNAGGISDAIIGRIFDFYFTTNEAGGGTGIGLYMSRNIIEKNMGGMLSAVNVDEGALFRIELSPT